MQNRVTVTVRGQSYTLLAVEDEAYVQRVAAYVDKKMAETAVSGLAQVDCGCAGEYHPGGSDAATGAGAPTGTAAHPAVLGHFVVGGQ